MKKLLTLLLILLMAFTMVGCNTKEDTPIVQELEQQEVIEEAEIVGGFVDVEDGTLTDELKDIFSKALEGLTGAKYEPIELVATQVVAGTNYKFLANGTKTTNPITKGTYYITIYKDLQDNVKLLDIEVIEEKQEVVKEETKKEIDPEVLKTYKYWVVFFNPDGTELQREALKWGTTPEYYDGIPYYYDGSYDYDFVGWTNKKGQPKELKPITGNTYFYAKYEISTGRKSESGGSNQPAPDPEYEVLTCLTGNNGAYINTQIIASDNMKFIFDANTNPTSWSNIFGSYTGYQSGIVMHSLDAARYPVLGYEIYFGNHAICPDTRSYLGSKATYEMQVKSGNSYLKINGNSVHSDTNVVSGVPALSIYIFAENYQGSAPAFGTPYSPVTIYYFKIYQNDVLVRDYIPVKTLKEIDELKNANNNTQSIPADTFCFYDKVNDMYYTNAGSSSFSDTPRS